MGPEFQLQPDLDGLDRNIREHDRRDQHRKRWISGGQRHVRTNGHQRRRYEYRKHKRQHRYGQHHVESR